MAEYCECAECGFVLVDNGADDRSPKRWGSCPGCDGSDFQQVDR